MKVLVAVILSVILLFLTVSPPQPASAATLYYLVQVENGKVVARLAVYGLLGECLSALAARKDRANLECRGEETGGTYSVNAYDWYLVGMPFSLRAGLVIYVFGGPYSGLECYYLKNDMALRIISAGFDPYCSRRGFLMELASTKGWTIKW